MKFLIISIMLISSAYSQFDYSPGFDAGQPIEMKRFEFLKGKWEIELFYTNEKSEKNPKWIFWEKSFSSFKSYYGGTFIMEESIGFPIQPPHEGETNWNYLATYSYDRFNEVYRVVFHDNILGLSDIYEGKNTTLDRLLISNINTVTFNNHGKNGVAQKNSVEISKIDDDSFAVIWRIVDADDAVGKSFDEIPWQWSVKMIYKRCE